MVIVNNSNTNNALSITPPLRKVRNAVTWLANINKNN